MRIVKLLVVAFMVVVGVCLGRALLLRAPAPAVVTAPPFSVDEAPAIERLRQALRIPTVSAEGRPPAAQSLDDLHALFRTAYPRVHQALGIEIINGGSLLMTWPGTDSALPPAILLAHQDVVPVDETALARWSHPPFDADLADGYVWARGALDDKVSVVAILEAAEALLEKAYRPRRTLMFAFGHDEELGGAEGAAKIVETLQARGVKAAFVLDEGGSLTRGVVPGVAGDVALVGISEKGYLSLELSVSGAGGHSSMPPPQSAIGILAAAIARLEAQPMPSRLTPVNMAMLDAIAPQQPFASRLVLGNRWLFAPLIRSMLGASPSGAATIRTTTAVTMLHAGVKDNVLPSEARAVVNFRLLPGDTVDDVMAHVQKVMADARIGVRVLPGFAPKEASPISPTQGPAWDAVHRAIAQTFPAATIAPFLVIGGTDSAHYTALSDSVYRFSPLPLTAEDLPRIHGIDERVGVEDYLRAVEFMGRLLLSAGQT